MDRVALEESANFIQKRTQYRPKIAIICGSGFGSLGDLMEDVDVIPYSDIPNFPISTAPGHKPRLLVGYLRDIPVLMMQGRFHLYEGFTIKECVFHVRVMKLLGIERIVTTNSSGAIQPNSLKVGDLVVLKDHIFLPGFSGINPLSGPNDDFFGSRFFAMSNCYDADMRRLAMISAAQLGLSKRVHQGVYAMLGGPNYETPAELQLLKVCGANLVGMSTAPEAIVARHCSMKIIAISLITNICQMEVDEGLNVNGEIVNVEEEALEVFKLQQDFIKAFITDFINRLHSSMIMASAAEVNGSIE